MGISIEAVGVSIGSIASGIGKGAGSIASAVPSFVPVAVAEAGFAPSNIGVSSFGSATFGGEINSPIGVPDVFQALDINLDPDVGPLVPIETSAPKFDIFSKVANDAWNKPLVEPTIPLENNFLSESSAVAEAESILFPVRLQTAEEVLPNNQLEDNLSMESMPAEDSLSGSDAIDEAIVILRLPQANTIEDPIIQEVSVPTVSNRNAIGAPSLLAFAAVRLLPIYLHTFPEVDINKTVFATVEPNIAVQTNTHVKSEQGLTYIQSQTSPSTSESPSISSDQEELEEKLEEVELKEKLTEEAEILEDPKESLEDEETKEKRVYLEDEPVSSQRKYEFRHALTKAKEFVIRLGLKKIPAWLVAKFIPAEHEGNRSQIVKKTGPDGSYQETVEAIADSGDFETENIALQKFSKIVAEKKPVKIGNNGDPINPEHIRRVFKYHLLKQDQPEIEVVRRESKKVLVSVQKSSNVVLVKTAVKPESKITDFPGWAEALKAA